MTFGTVSRKPMIMRLLDDRAAKFVLSTIIVAAFLVPILNLIVPESSALHVPSYVVALLGKYLTYALLALSVDLVWGYCGILSLGHGAFFSLGGYAIGMYMMRQIGDRGVYGNPDFLILWCF